MKKKIYELILGWIIVVVIFFSIEYYLHFGFETVSITKLADMFKEDLLQFLIILLLLGGFLVFRNRVKKSPPLPRGNRVPKT